MSNLSLKNVHRLCKIYKVKNEKYRNVRGQLDACKRVATSELFEKISSRYEERELVAIDRRMAVLNFKLTSVNRKLSAISRRRKVLRRVLMKDVDDTAESESTESDTAIGDDELTTENDDSDYDEEAERRRPLAPELRFENLERYPVEDDIAADADDEWDDVEEIIQAAYVGDVIQAADMEIIQADNMEEEVMQVAEVINHVDVEELDSGDDFVQVL